MRLTSGVPFSIPEMNQPVPGCTISEQVHMQNGNSIDIFSIAAGTSISAECYDYHKLLYVLEGEMEILSNDTEVTLHTGDSYVTPLSNPVGMRSDDGCVYLECNLRKDTNMNNILNAGEVFQLKDLLPYQEGRIVNMDLASNDNMKFVLMSFDAGTGLSEHAAPGDALVFALDGEAVIGYEGTEHTIHAGETFKFDKMGKHSVTATKQFKMALLLVLE